MRHAECKECTPACRMSDNTQLGRWHGDPRKVMPTSHAARCSPFATASRPVACRGSQGHRLKAVGTCGQRTTAPHRYMYLRLRMRHAACFGTGGAGDSMSHVCNVPSHTLVQCIGALVKRGSNGAPAGWLCPPALTSGTSAGRCCAPAEHCSCALAARPRASAAGWWQRLCRPSRQRRKAQRWRRWPRQRQQQASTAKCQLGHVASA